MSPIPRLKDYRGPALLSYGFRPFFLLGALYAGFAILAWLPMLNGKLELSTAFSPFDWHVHEMVYGYLPAVVALIANFGSNRRGNGAVISAPPYRSSPTSAASSIRLSLDSGHIVASH